MMIQESFFKAPRNPSSGLELLEEFREESVNRNFLYIWQGSVNDIDQTSGKGLQSLHEKLLEDLSENLLKNLLESLLTYQRIYRSAEEPIWIEPVEEPVGEPVGIEFKTFEFESCTS